MAWAHFDELKTVKVKQEGKHIFVTLARPGKSNALDDTMWTEIPQVICNSKFCVTNTKSYISSVTFRCSKHWTRWTTFMRYEASSSLPLALTAFPYPCECMFETHGSDWQIVLGGEGKNFCAGIDTASLEADFVKPSTTTQCPARARERLLHKIKSSQHTITAIEKCRWPVIAAVQGVA